MSKFCIILGALLFVQLCAAARIARDAPATQQVPSLSEVAEKAQSTFKQINDDFLKLLGMETNEQLVTKIQTESKTFVELAKTQFEEIEKKVNNENTQEFVKNMKAQLEELTKENPAVTADAKVLNEKFQSSLQKVVRETDRFGAKLAKEGASVGDDVQKLLKTFVDSTVETAKKLTETKA